MSTSPAPPRVLLAGGNGYVGCRLAVHLAGLGWHVRTGSRNPVAIGGVEHLGITPQKLDWADPRSLAEACAGCDFVVHLAAPNEIVAGGSKSAAITGTLLTTVDLLDAAKQAGVKRFIYFSTAHVYGGPLAGLLQESDNPQPRHPYSITHRCAEDFVLAEATAEFLPIVIRLSNALGAPAIPGTDRWKLVGNDLCRQAVETGKIVLTSDGTALRDFIPLRDVCRAVEFLISHETSEKNLLVNVGSGVTRTIREVAEMVASQWKQRSGNEVPIHYGPPAGPPTPFEFSIGKLLALGFSFESSLEEEIQATLHQCEKWFATP